jgi:hypothetical protein
MKNLRWAIVALFAVFVQSAYADSVLVFNISRVTISFGANESGDNSLFAFGGPGTSIVGGGSACNAFDTWCLSGALSSPGTFLVPNVELVSFDGLSSVKIGGQSYDPGAVGLFNSSITAVGFRFPAGGNSPFVFTVTVPARLTSPVQGELPDGTFFDLNTPPEKLVLTFNYVPAAHGFPGGYSFSDGKYIILTPEPGTICLIGTGLAAMVGRKRSWRRSTPN